MGKAERLLDALAAKLWRTKDREILLTALRAAATSLPQEQEKLRGHLKEDEFSCLQGLLFRIDERRRQHAAELAASALRAAEAQARNDKQGQVDAAENDIEEETAIAAYEDVAESGPGECLVRCLSLLQKALLQLPAVDGKQGVRNALEGFLAVFPAELPVSTLALGQLGRVLSFTRAACGTVNDDDKLLGGAPMSRTWRRLLQLSLLTWLRVSTDSGIPTLLANGQQHEKRQEAMVRLGAIIALIRATKAKRFALRELFKIVSLSPPTEEDHMLESIVTSVLPIARSCIGGREMPLEPVERIDAEVLLRGLGFVGVCKSAGVDSPELQELRTLLQEALHKVVDATLLLPEARRMVKTWTGPEAKSLRKLVAPGGAAAKNKATAARAVARVAEGQVASSGGSQKAPRIEGLLSMCGLPKGELDEIDEKAAIARARGDIFFEDVGPAATDGVGEQEPVAEEQQPATGTSSKGKKRAGVTKVKAGKARKMARYFA
mmetsp:Transcript_25911/g.59853  ORF Transcript_25911/g.59853 Transcript_25911/m.59853 type:complete len:493 (-) Transcript_25911:8-1486(-)